jgi:2-keto-3-deoxy-L-rhamnonate aldolase RhmA
MVFSTDAAATGVLASAGYEFVVIDQEHAPNDTQTTLNHIRAAEANGIIPLVRVGENNPKLISLTLDMGAHGIIVPTVGTAAEAEAAVQATRYGPGGRGMCASVEGARWVSSDGWAVHRERSNRNVALIPLIETRQGVDNIGDIAAVDGIDLLFFGMADLSQDLGLDYHRDKAEILDIWRSALETVHARGAWLGAPAGHGFEGADFNTIKSDLLLLKAAATQQLAEHRAEASLANRPEAVTEMSGR